jgi:signal peptidase I
VTLGDHLFVERFSIYLKSPERGDIIVFNTEYLFVQDTPLAATGGYYYIKRVAALPGDTVKISGNQLWVRPAGQTEFRRIQDLDSRFEKIYSMRGGYHGHLSDMGMEKFAFGEEFTVPEDNFLMLGDNSRFSMDSRYFGTVPRRNLIGRAWMVFYPFSRRLGLIDRQSPVDEPTGVPGIATFPVMSKQ